jgi:hypothetical protein
MKRWFHILVTLATIAAAETAEAQDAPDPWMTRFSARHVAGEGVGHTSGYSSLDWFLPLSAESDSTMWFGDFRGLIFNDGEFGSNVGTGYRWFVEEHNRIYGINGYWDTRNNDSLLFNQAGIGLESLGQIFDFRINGYTPAVNDTYQQGDLYFSGNGLFLPSTSALSGMDAEAGVNFPTFYQIATRLFGGSYYYDSSHTIAAAGWRVRAEAAWRDNVVVGVAVQDDDLFGQTINGMIELRYTAFHRTSLAPRSMRHKFRDADGVGDGITVRHRLADPVYRRQNIVLHRQDDRLTQSGGTPLNFLHVVPGGTGTGTFENPYGTISNAMLDPLAPTGVVYTPFGGTFNENVTMTAGSTLFSNGPSQLVSTNVGTAQLPFSGSNSSLTALPSRIVGNVTLANNTVLNGFDVQGGISGTNVTNSSLINNRIASSPGNAITLTSSSGVSMNNLLIANPVGRGILLNDSSASLSSVTIQNSGNTALEINTGANDRTVTATGLSITNTAGSIKGIDANVTGVGDLLLSISGTPGSSTASNSISVQQDAVNVSTAVGSTGDAIVQLSSLAVSSSAGSGIVVDGNAGTGTATVTGFSGNSVTKAATGGVLFNEVTFDSSLTTAGFQPVSAGTLTIGAVPGDVAGDGVSIQNSTGNVNLGVAKIFNNDGAGLFVATSPNLTVSSTTGSTVETQLGPVLDLSNTITGLNFTSLKSENSPGVNHGIHLNNVTGTINSTTTTLIDSQAPAAILIENIPVAPNSLTPKFGALTIESLFDNTEATNISLPGVNTGIVQPIYTAPLTIVFP